MNDSSAIRVSIDTSLKDVLAAMAAAQEFHAVVVQQGQPVGRVSFSALLQAVRDAHWDRSQAFTDAATTSYTCQNQALAHPPPLSPAAESARQPSLHLLQEPLQQVVQGAGLGVWDWHVQTGQLVWSPELEKLCGLSPGSFDGRYDTFLQLVPPEERTSLHQHIQTVLKTCKYYRLEFSVVHPNGSRHDLLMQGQISTAPPQRRMTGLVFDVTAHRQAEDALRRHNERQRIVGELAQKIRQVLDLDSVLKQAVIAVREFIRADRVIVMQCHPNASATVVQETCDPAYASMMSWTLRNPWLMKPDYMHRLKQGLGFAINDIQNHDLPLDEIEFLRFFQIQAEVIFPLMQEEVCWGFIVAHQCDRTRIWETAEVELLSTLATQVSIAIQQAKLHQELRQANNQLQRLVFLDGLTQVANRRRFEEHLRQEWRRLSREQHPLSLLMCDIDNFKGYNDHYGHPAGDQCLRKVAQALQKAIKRPADLVARYGGEEFAVILPHTDAKGAETIAEEIHFDVRRLRIPHQRSPNDQIVTVSIGVAACVPRPGGYQKDLIAKADKALYQAKQAGRDRIILAS